MTEDAPKAPTPPVAPTPPAAPAPKPPAPPIVPKPKSEKVEEQVLAYRALKPFHTTIFNSVKRYKAGQIETDYITIQHLLKTKAPVVKVNDDTVMACPECKAIIPTKG